MLTIAHVAAVMLVLPCWRISAQPFMELVCSYVNIRTDILIDLLSLYSSIWGADGL